MLKIISYLSRLEIEWERRAKGRRNVTKVVGLVGLLSVLGLLGLLGLLGIVGFVGLGGALGLLTLAVTRVHTRMHLYIILLCLE